MEMQVLCGQIASGKSTYCRQAANHGAIILNDDSIVTALHAGNYKLYKKELKPLYKSIENCLISTSLSMGLSIVVDRPNFSVNMRKRYISIAKSFDCPVKIVLFKREDPEIHGRRRFESESRGHTLEYWTNVAKEHERLFEFPNKELEGFDEIFEWNFQKQD